MELNWKEDSNLIRKLAKILLGDTLPNGKPVSYTHLDVYKRQMLDMVDFNRVQHIFLPICAFFFLFRGSYWFSLVG